MADEADNTPKIYRYKFSNGFLPNLLDFARIHRYDEPTDFKEQWDLYIPINPICRTSSPWGAIAPRCFRFQSPDSSPVQALRD